VGTCPTGQACVADTQPAADEEPGLLVFPKGHALQSSMVPPGEKVPAGQTLQVPSPVGLPYPALHLHCCVDVAVTKFVSSASKQASSIEVEALKRGNKTPTPCCVCTCLTSTLLRLMDTVPYAVSTHLNGLPGIYPSVLNTKTSP